MQFKIKRTSISSYFCTSFKEDEIKALENFGTFLESSSSEFPDILITNTHTNFNDYSQEFLDNLKLVLHPNSGFDNYPEEIVKKIKAPIIIGNTIRSQAVSQYILSAIFNHYLKIPHSKQWDKSRKWDRPLLEELNVLIIGYGHIGRTVHSSLRPIVKNIDVYDPYENLNDINPYNRDIIILAASLNSKNHHMIDASFLNKISKDALIINSARGELIDTDALIKHLEQNHNSFAILDVFEKEPNDFKDFQNINNVLLSSHIAGVHKNIDKNTIEFEFNTIKDFVELDPINFKTKYHKMILQNRFRENIGLI